MREEKIVEICQYLPWHFWLSQVPSASWASKTFIATLIEKNLQRFWFSKILLIKPSIGKMLKKHKECTEATNTSAIPTFLVLHFTHTLHIIWIPSPSAHSLHEDHVSNLLPTIDLSCINSDQLHDRRGCPFSLAVAIRDHLHCIQHGEWITSFRLFGW